MPWQPPCRPGAFKLIFKCPRAPTSESDGISGSFGMISVHWHPAAGPRRRAGPGQARQGTSSFNLNMIQVLILTHDASRQRTMISAPSPSPPESGSACGTSRAESTVTEAAACAAAIIMMILVRLSQQSESDSDIPWRPATVRGAACLRVGERHLPPPPVTVRRHWQIPSLIRSELESQAALES
jgi:hypothetical protein